MLSLARSSLATALARKPGVQSFASWQKQFPKFFKSSSVCVVRDCRAQIEFVIAYRVRRGLQLLVLYSKLGEEHALLRCFLTLKRHFVRFSKTAFTISAAVVKFSWDQERIKDDEMVCHMNDLDLCHRLMKKFNLKAPLCDEKVPANQPEDGFLKFVWSENCWHPFVSLDNLTIWKKQTSEQASKTLACYKIYGHFDDVKALSFLQAYLDLETRKTWDQHVLKLEVVESEPSTNSDLIYWISKWPRLFSNRDYVYKRRYVIDYNRQVISVVSKAAKHPDYPPSKENWRVENYWSYLTVRPKKSFQEKGLEFSLTYYDDPGSNLPSSMLIWATVHGMPNYFKQLHQETLKIDKLGGGGGGSLIDFKKTEEPEVDPYELYEHEVEEEVEDKFQGSQDDDKPETKPERKVLGNVPFPLPPPSDPSKPPLLPRELSPKEINRSWEQVKSIVKESVDNVIEKSEDGNRALAKPVESEILPPRSGEAPQPVDGANSHPKTTSMMKDTYMGRLVGKTSELMKVSNCGFYDCDLDGTLLLTIADQTILVEAILRLKRVIFKILFDRTWR